MKLLVSFSIQADDTETHPEDAANLMSIVCQTSQMLLPEEEEKRKDFNSIVQISPD